jgi:hypothetical protein
MKIAIHNPFFGQHTSETEQAKRIILAAKSLAWEAAELGTEAEIEKYKPDFVLALHVFTAKIPSFLTYGCMWNPPKYFEHKIRAMRHVFSYDGYLSGASEITTWVSDALLLSGRNRFIETFYPSCHYIPYHEPDLNDPRLFYTGVHWDGPRYQELFEELDSSGILDVFGKNESWIYLRQSFRGPLPFDGVSITKALNEAGIGLCLHMKKHIDSATPSSRIFEIAASGAIAICQDHPFIRENFGDAVLYIAREASASDWCDEIANHINWIASNKNAALAMSRRSHNIFAERFTYEHLLKRVEELHRNLLEGRSVINAKPSRTSAKEYGQALLRLPKRSTCFVQQAVKWRLKRSPIKMSGHLKEIRVRGT